MKKILLIAILFASVLCNSQKVEKISTSAQEYNYLSEVYEKSVETGTPLMDGYELKPIYSDVLDQFTVTYSSFIYTQSGKAHAVLITINKDKGDKDKTVYLCLPFNNDALHKKFIAKTSKLGITMKLAFDISMYKTVSNAFDKQANRSK